MPVNSDGRAAIEALIGWHCEKYAPPRAVASVVPLAESEGDSRDEQADGPRDAQSGVSGCRLERQDRHTFPAEIVCAGGCMSRAATSI